MQPPAGLHMLLGMSEKDNGGNFLNFMHFSQRVVFHGPFLDRLSILSTSMQDQDRNPRCICDQDRNPRCICDNE